MNLSRLFRCVSVAGVIFSMIGAPEVFAQARAVGRIQGRVFTGDTREPVGGAVVRAVLPLSDRAVTQSWMLGSALAPGQRAVTRVDPVVTVTDDSGRFAINWVRSGMWQVTVSVEGFDNLVRLIQVTRGRSYACSSESMRCREPVEFSIVKRFDPVHPTQAPSGGALAGLLADDLQAELDAAYDLFDSGDYDGAIASYEAVLKQVPLLTSLHLQIGHAYRAKEDFERALLAYRAVPAHTTAGAEAESAIQDLNTVGSVR